MDSFCTSSIYWNAFYNISQTKVSKIACLQSWRLQCKGCISNMDYQMVEGELLDPGTD